MKLSYRITVIAFSPLLAVGYASAQSGHEAHEQKAAATTQPPANMSMPAMDEIHFVESMIKHHKDGIEMTRLEESRGAHDGVKALAAKIREGQESDLKVLEAHHGGGTAPKPHGTAGHDAKPHAPGDRRHEAAMLKHHEMMEQMAKESVQKIESASGPAVDAAFVREMAKHHEMALQMIAKTTFKDTELRKLSQKMAAMQKRELAELKKHSSQ